MSLYLKYRPQGFASVVGQTHVVTTLKNAARQGAISHAYLFAGPRGTGKTSLARILARTVNCEKLSREGEPCGTCAPCIALGEGRLVDLIEIDAASNRGIDEIRELKEKIVYAPTQAKAKVYIIDEVHMLTKEAFNALLKTLEEPPSHAYFILATTELHKIPETIVSRCQQFAFRRIGSEDLVQRLADIAASEGITAEPAALKLIGRLAAGGMRDAIGLLEQMSQGGEVTEAKVSAELGLIGSSALESFYEALQKQEALTAIQKIGEWNAEGRSLQQLASEFLHFLRGRFLEAVEKRACVQNLLETIDAFTQARMDMNHALIPSLPLEIAVIKACRYESAAPAVKAHEKTAAPAKKEAAAKETPAAAPQDLPSLSLSEIKTKWPRVLEKIETPYVSLSLKNGEPTAYEAGELKIGFQAQSMMEKVQSTQNQTMVAKAIEDVFGAKIRLKLELKKIKLTSAVEMAREAFDL